MRIIFDRKAIFRRLQNIKFDSSLHDKITEEVFEELEDYLIIFSGKKDTAPLQIITEIHEKTGNKRTKYFRLQENDTENIVNLNNLEKNDIIIGVNSLHNVNYLQEYLQKIHAALNNGGTFCGNFFGPNNLSKLKKTLTENDSLFSKQIYPRFNPTISGESLQALLQSAGFTNIVISLSKIPFTFKSFHSATKFLKDINERLYTAARQKSMPNRRIFQENLNKEIELDFEIIKFYALKK